MREGEATTSANDAEPRGLEFNMLNAWAEVDVLGFSLKLASKHGDA